PPPRRFRTRGAIPIPWRAARARTAPPRRRRTPAAPSRPGMPPPRAGSKNAPSSGYRNVTDGEKGSGRWRFLVRRVPDQSAGTRQGGNTRGLPRRLLDGLLKRLLRHAQTPGQVGGAEAPPHEPDRGSKIGAETVRQSDGAGDFRERQPLASEPLHRCRIALDLPGDVLDERLLPPRRDLTGRGHHGLRRACPHRGDPEAPLFPDEDPEVPQINEPGGPSIDGDGPAGRRPADRSRRRLEERDEVPPVAVAQIHGHEIPEPA